MNSTVMNTAHEYRQRAERARTRAAVAVTDQARDSLLQIAETWECMAVFEERTNPRRHLSLVWASG